MTRRMRMIAGPNGSGKSTAIRNLLKPEWLGYYLNPDDIQKTIETKGYFDVTGTGISTDEKEILGFFWDSVFLASMGLRAEVQKLSYRDEKLQFDRIVRDESLAYIVSALADFV